jgi:hypothetical protein
MHNCKSEADYLCLCKQMIGQHLGWPYSSEWKQRDFLNLISLIEEKSGITLSLSTIKRIWRPDYRKLPHPATLDAFARFLDYENWLDFKNKNQQNTDISVSGGIIYTGGSMASQKSLNGGKGLFQNKQLRVNISILALSVLPVILFVIYQAYDLKSTSPATVTGSDVIEFYTSTSVSEGVPNTVIFHFDVSNIDADSFLVQQSWNMLKKDRIDKSDKKLSSVYFYPGIHKARIVANDDILKEINVRINTGDWLAMARNGYSDGIPVYIRDSDIRQNGKMHVTAGHLELSNVDINHNTIVSYFYVDEFAELDSGNFTLETRLRADSIFNYTCPHISICVLGDGDVNHVLLTTKGCVGNSELKMGDNFISGLNNDMSLLGADLYDWQYVKIIARDNRAFIHLNEKLVFEMPFNEDIGEISGININFTGTGIIDFVRLYNQDNLLVFDSGRTDRT